MLSLLALPSDWQEATSELSFSDVEALISKALRDSHNGDDEYYDSYWVYKVWPDKVICKRSYAANDGPLFKLYPYTVKEQDGKYSVALGEPKEVNQLFVPVGSEPADALMAVREADTLSADDPEYLANILEEGDDEDGEEESEEKSQKEGEIEEATLQEAEARLRETGKFEIDFFDCPMTEAKVDCIQEGKSKRYVIRNVAMLAEVSKNGRKYPAKVQREAVPIFEGIKAYADHPTKANENEPRRVKDLIGRYRDVYFDEGKVKTFGDLHLMPTDLVTGYIVPIAESDPSAVGSSINVYGNMDSKGTVEKITKGRSVDVVTEPAATQGLYESVDKSKDKITDKGEENMAIKKEDVLSDENLMEELREHILGEQEVLQSYEAKDNKIKEQDEKIRGLEEENAKLKLAESTRVTETEIDGLLAKSKLPDDAKKEIRPIMQKAGSAEERKQIIERMEGIVESVRKSAKPIDPSVHIEEDPDKGKSQKLSDSDLTKKIIESFTSRQR